MAEVHLCTLPADLISEEALLILPSRGAPPAEIMLFGEGVRAIDAWGAAALRCKIEYYARYQQRRVTLSTPSDDATCRLLHALIRFDHPAHLVLPNDAKEHNAPVPTNCYLPAQRVRSVAHADNLADLLFDQADGRTRKALRFCAGWIPELRLNVEQHTVSPIEPVVCVIYDRHEDEVQLVISDLGTRMSRRGYGDLWAAVGANPDSTINSIVDLAAERDLDVSLTIASGDGRLYWRGGLWSEVQAELVPGFTVAFTIPVF